MPALNPFLARLRGLLLLAGLSGLLSGCFILDMPEHHPQTMESQRPVHDPVSTTRFLLPSAETNVVGILQVVRLREQDTLIDVALAYQLGFDELVAANPGVDPWLPGEGREVVLPSRFVLPDAPREGIVLNIPAKRLFYFPEPEAGSPAEVYTFPVSIGREGWGTPYGLTRVVSKRKNPTWHVPASIRKEHAENGDPLPAAVPPGPDNPLGAHAMRLGFTSGAYLIHGTNKPAGIGIRTSHGCIRMSPRHVEWLYEATDIGVPVRVINQPALAGAVNGEVLLEVHAALEEDKAPDVAALRRMVAVELERIGADTGQVDEERVVGTAREQHGIPMSVMAGAHGLGRLVAAAPRVTNVVSYEWFEDDSEGDSAVAPAATPSASR